jgi:hypothetical protein
VTLRLALLALVLAAAGCAADPPYVPSPMTGEPTPTHPPEDAWARVLKASVDARGAVDFDALMANHADLDRYVAWIYQRAPERWPNLYKTRAHELAYHVNAYNALVLYNYLQSGLPQSFSVLERRQFFGKHKLFVGGRPLTLQEYREIIRRLGEPRLAFALSDQLERDPFLAREPYRASTLEAQLDRAARGFLADERNVRVDDARRTVTLAPLLEAYAADFPGGAPSLTAYVNRYRDAAVPAAYEVRFAGTEWKVRRGAPRSAQ